MRRARLTSLLLLLGGGLVSAGALVLATAPTTLERAFGLAGVLVGLGNVVYVLLRARRR